jgi:hypothetical protein
MQIDIKDAIRFALQSVIDCGGMHPKQEGRELTIWDHWIGTQKISDIYFLHSVGVDHVHAKAKVEVSLWFPDDTSQSRTINIDFASSNFTEHFGVQGMLMNMCYQLREGLKMVVSFNK